MRIRDPLTRTRRAIQPCPIDGYGLQSADLFHGCHDVHAGREGAWNRAPHVSTLTPLSAPPKQLIINIKQDGTAVVAGKAYTPRELAPLVAALMKKDPEGAVIIRADERTVFAISPMSPASANSRACRKLEDRLSGRSAEADPAVMAKGRCRNSC